MRSLPPLLDTGAGRCYRPRVSIVLGINAYHAGASAALVVDGVPVMAVAEERLNRVKYYGGFPTQAVTACLDAAGVRLSDVDAVAVGRDGSANLLAKAEYALRHPSKLLNLAKIRTKSRRQEDIGTELSKALGVGPEQARFAVHNIEHHLAHTASAYFISPWESAAGITIDGSGDFVSCMMSRCEGDKITPVHRIHVPHSLGSLYTTVCQFIGYGKYGDEGKVMGLAPLGRDSYGDFIEQLVRLTDEGFELTPEFFLPFGSDPGEDLDESGQMVLRRQFSDRFEQRFGAPTERGTPPSQRDMDLAFGVQKLFERAYMHLLNLLHARVPNTQLVLAGGCALNSVANGKLFFQTPFRKTCIQPAAGDDGLALGAALHVAVTHFGERRWVMRDAYLGPEFSEVALRAALDAAGVRYTRLDQPALVERTVQALAAGEIVGWFQGRTEWGPRALGNRSILAHPGKPDMKDTLNARIKHREAFRPFAPAVLTERQAEIFSHDHPSPFMLHVYDIKPEWRERLCAVTHVDGTGRLQSVAREENPLYYDLIARFGEVTGIPVLLNTSFNENEPIVCKPEEAVACFQRTRMDVLVLGPYFCEKSDQRG